MLKVRAARGHSVVTRLSPTQSATQTTRPEFSASGQIINMISARSTVFRHVGQCRGICSRAPLVRRAVGRPGIKDGIVPLATWRDINRQIRLQSGTGESPLHVFRKDKKYQCVPLSSSHARSEYLAKHLVSSLIARNAYFSVAAATSKYKFFCQAPHLHSFTHCPRSYARHLCNRLHHGRRPRNAIPPRTRQPTDRRRDA